MSPWAIPAALAGALCYALASAVQQQEAARAPAAAASGPRLVLHLLTRPRWLAGVAATAAGAALHISALRLGPLAIIQPIGITGLLFALPLGAALHARRIGRSELLSAAVVVAGLGGLLASVQVQAGTPSISEPSTLLLAVVTGAIALLAAVVGGRLSGRARAVVLAAGAGVAFGVTSALVRVVAHRAGVVGAEPALLGLSTLVLIGSAVLGMLLSQSAYQAGSLAAALPTLTVGDPLVAIAVGELLLGEPVLFSPIGAIGAVASCLLILTGTVRLARDHSPEARREPPGDRHPERNPSTRVSRTCAS